MSLRLIEQRPRALFLLSGRLDHFLGLGHLGAQFLEQGLVTARLRLADLLRLRIARLFGFLLVGHGLTQRAVMGEDLVDLFAHARRAPLPRRTEGIGVFANGTQVEHGGLASLGCFAAV